MEILTHRVAYRGAGRTTEYRVKPIGDVHLGNVGCDLKRLKEDIEEIKHDPTSLWVGMGDYTECINITDKRFDPQSIDPNYNIRSLSRLVDAQIEDIAFILKPIASKCIGFLTGNHEEEIRLRSQRDASYDIAKSLGILDKYMGYDGFIRLIFTRNKHDTTLVTFYCCHGYGGARKSGAKINKLEDFAHSFDADIIILAHEHKKIIAPPVLKLGLNSIGDLIQKKQFAVMSGSYLKGYVQGATTYVEKKGYPPSDLGTVTIKIKPRYREIHIES